MENCRPLELLINNKYIERASSIMSKTKNFFSESKKNELIKKIVYYFKTYFDDVPYQEQIDWYLSVISDGKIKLENLEQHFQNSPARKGADIKKHGCVYTKYGTKMYLDKNDKFISRDIATFYCWEPEYSEFLKNYIKKGINIVDVGANIGYYTLLFSKWIGDLGKVYAFEPGPDNYKLLLKNIKANNCMNVVSTQKAVSNKTEKNLLFLAGDGNSGDHRLLNSFDFELHNRNKIEINTITLDSYLPHEQKIDFIKMDIQGSEMMAFEGMTNVINRSDNITIFFEFWPYAIKKSGFHPKESFNKILDMGFKISKIENGNKIPLSLDFEMLEKYETWSQINLLCEKS